MDHPSARPIHRTVSLRRPLPKAHLPLAPQPPKTPGHAHALHQRLNKTARSAGSNPRPQRAPPALHRTLFWSLTQTIHHLPRHRQCHGRTMGTLALKDPTHAHARSNISCTPGNKPTRQNRPNANPIPSHARIHRQSGNPPSEQDPGRSVRRPPPGSRLGTVREGASRTSHGSRKCLAPWILAPSQAAHVGITPPPAAHVQLHLQVRQVRGPSLHCQRQGKRPLPDPVFHV